MRKLSKPIADLQPAYDLVIIGSGYGGSIAASRFARAGQRVCLLEKGKEFQPGDYPVTILEAENEMQLNSAVIKAEKNGLYDFHIGDGISVFKGCGLGGTSQVNAGVMIKPEDRVFLDPRWPKAIRDDREGLSAAYEQAREMLKPAPYPVKTQGYPELAKSRAMQASALAMGEEFRYTDINVNFSEGMNHVGVSQQKCTNCGDCVTGCNHSAKNTLIMNYLPDAVNHGAQIFCNINVEFVERIAGQWIIWFDVFGSDRDKFKAPAMFTRASQVIIAGGALGSTEILLRSQLHGLALSSTLGTRFTGNGDVLGFSYNGEQEIDGMGLGHLFQDIRYRPVGPCITSIIDMRNRPVLEDGITLEEGSIPAPLVSLMNLSLINLAGSIGVREAEGFSSWLRDCGKEASSLINGPYHGATNHTQTFLVMTHDKGNGQMSLVNGNLEISWPGVGKEEIFKKVEKALLGATNALGGTFIRDLVWGKQFDYQLVSVHPLGGCAMADDSACGVVDDIGNVYTGIRPSETHTGLYVLDGSILPLPLGTNPLFTISALTERACTHILASMNLKTTYDFPPVFADCQVPGPAIQFTETMKGFFSLNEPVDFQKGYDAGEQQGSAILFTLTIETIAMEQFLINPEHPGMMSGTVIAPVLSAKPLTISKGLFNLFVKDIDNPEHLRMNYQMQLNTVEGKTYFFTGYKKVDGLSPTDLWNDTTILYITVFKDDSAQDVLGKGIMKIAAQDFATQMTTMKALHTQSLMESLMAIKSFSTFFSEEIIETYFKRFF